MKERGGESFLVLIWIVINVCCCCCSADGRTSWGTGRQQEHRIRGKSIIYISDGDVLQILMCFPNICDGGSFCAFWMYEKLKYLWEGSGFFQEDLFEHVHNVFIYIQSFFVTVPDNKERESGLKQPLPPPIPLPFLLLLLLLLLLPIMTFCVYIVLIFFMIICRHMFFSFMSRHDDL